MRVKFKLEDLKTDIVDITTLRPYAKNPRNGDIDLIANSLDAHGMYRPIVVASDGVVLCGNHTYAALMQNGEKRVAVTQLPIKSTDPQAAEIVLMDNRASDMAKYDDGLLAQLLEEVKGAQQDLFGTGFNDSYLESLMAKINVQPPANFPEVNEGINTDYRCPSCGFAWSGKPK